MNVVLVFVTAGGKGRSQRQLQTLSSPTVGVTAFSHFLRILPGLNLDQMTCSGDGDDEVLELGSVDCVVSLVIQGETEFQKMASGKSGGKRRMTIFNL